MPDAPPRRRRGAGRCRATLLLLLCALAAPALAQDLRPRFEPHDALVRLGFHDGPAFLDASSASGFGRLLGDPDIAATLALLADGFAARVARWTTIVEAARAADLELVSPDVLAAVAVLQLDWSQDLSGLEIVAAMPALDAGADGEATRQLPLTVTLVEPRQRAEGRLAQRFEQLAQQLAEHPELRPTEQQRVASYAAYVFDAVTTDDDPSLAGMLRHLRGTWLLHLPGQIAAGNGAPATAGTVRPTAAPEPGVELQLGLSAIRRMSTDPGGVTDPDYLLFDALFDIAHLGRLRWRLSADGDRLRDEASVELLGDRPGGLLGALVDGRAPLADQPLPEGGLLQLRLAFDVDQLLSVCDRVLALAELPRLAQLGLREDLALAWSGAVTLGLCTPQPGGVVPRLYASFGVADRAAAERLLTRIGDAGVPTRAVEYGDAACTQVLVPDAPAALQPTWHLRDGVLHWAESGRSMRTLTEAIAADRPPALDTGAAPVPDGDGEAVPGFDLRFDGAAIYRAVHEIWQPLYTTTMRLSQTRLPAPLLDPADMPDTDTVTGYLGPGRGVLRRSGDRLVLSATGPAGGPEVHALLAAFPTMFSGMVLRGWQVSVGQVEGQLSRRRLTQCAAALASFRETHGRPPKDLGELVAVGGLAAELLQLPGDEAAEPVVHQGRELGRSSYRYYPDGLKVAPQGNDVQAAMIEIRPMGYWRNVLDHDGNVIQAWMMGPDKTIEAIEQEANK